MARGGKKTQLCALGEKGCLKPTGTVTWVFCESSEQWFHCPCVNVDSKKANDDDFIFICPALKPQKEKVNLICPFHEFFFSKLAYLKIIYFFQKKNREIKLFQKSTN